VCLLDTKVVGGHTWTRLEEAIPKKEEWKALAEQYYSSL
jgi:hypothetical protein